MAGKSTFIAVPPDLVNNPQSLARFLYTLVEKLDVAFGNRGNGGFATPSQALAFARTQAGAAEAEAAAAGSAAATAALNLAKIYTDDEVSASATSTLAAANLYTDEEIAALFSSGSWTPEIDSETAGTGRSTTVNSASYYKINNLVYFECDVTLATLGSGGSGDLVIRGLPYTASSSSHSCTVGNFQTLGSNVTYISATVEPSSTLVKLRGTTAASTSVSALTFSTFATTNTQLVVSGVYTI